MKIWRQENKGKRGIVVAVLIVTVLMLSLAGVVQKSSAAQIDAPITGIYEICIGVTDPLPQIRYWELMGYRLGPIGELKAEEAKALYGVDSKLRAVRLLHQDADHGLIRLLIWDKPTNDGLKLAKMLAPGSRWSSTMTRDVLSLWNHSEALQRAGMPVHIVTPQWSVIYKTEQGEPFIGDQIGVRELIVMQPFTRNMFFQRFGYEVKGYGAINDAAKFKTSQVTHVGLVFENDDPNVLNFYRDVLGLVMNGPEVRYDYDTADVGSRNLYGMKPGDVYFSSSFGDPRASKTPGVTISGRMLTRRIPTTNKDVNLIERSRPGSLGYSLYTYRVADIAQYHVKVKASIATLVTDVLKNEFGEPSFSFRSPDGHSWTLVGK